MSVLGFYRRQAETCLRLAREFPDRADRYTLLAQEFLDRATEPSDDLKLPSQQGAKPTGGDASRH
jgi:hypothetical protein